MKKLIVLVFIVVGNVLGGICQSNSNDIVLTPQTIMKLTYQNSKRINSAYHKLEAAKYNFKIFEREYTQFNPVIINSGLYGSSDNLYQSETSYGMEKEFFNGSLIQVETGYDTEWGRNSETQYTQYIETNVSFPLFTSNRKLSRLIKRTFEENELFSAHLEYVDAIRGNIRNALEMYYDFVPRYKIFLMYNRYKKVLTTILENDSLKTESGILQIQAEINSINSIITGWESTVNSLKMDMQRWMNVPTFGFEQIQTIDINFDKSVFFGNQYIIDPVDTILNRAIKNDTEFKVLHLIKKNAEEKKKLAQKGRWDIYTNIGSKYDFYSHTGNQSNPNFLFLTGGIQIKMYDKKLLNYTIQKSLSDIAAIEATIEDRKLEIKNEIAKRKDVLLKKRDQIYNTKKSLIAWKSNFEKKKTDFIQGRETADNLLQAFRSLTSTEVELFSLENRYLDTVRDLDYICGVYFEYLEIDIAN